MNDLLKQVAKPPKKHSTRTITEESLHKYPTRYDKCACGEWKSKISPHCWLCGYNLRHTSYLDRTKCPECGEHKEGRAKICRRCRDWINKPPILDNVFIIEDTPCRKVPLTRGQYALVNDFKYDEVMQYIWRWDKGYAVTYTGNHLGDGTRERIYMHNLIMPPPPGYQTDHKNRQRADNRISNLRVSTPNQNARNTGKRSNNTTGYKGVIKRNKRFVAQIRVNSKNIYIGASHIAEEAAKMRDQVARKCHGEFADLNFPDET